MTTETLSPQPKQKFFDNNGNPADRYRIFTYQAGTTTKLSTYTDSTGGTPNSNPITLNYRGECDLWIPPNVAYKYVFAPPGTDDPPTSSIWTVDNVVNSQLLTLYGGVDTGIANAYVLNFTSQFVSYTDGIIIYWIPSHTNSGASTININGLGVAAITNQDGSALRIGQIIANNVVGILYKGTGFILLNVNAVGLTPTINVQNTNYTLALTDAYNIVLHNDSTPYNYIIPDDATVNFAVGTNIEIINQSNASLAIQSGGAAVYVFGAPTLVSGTPVLAPSTATTFIKTAANTWIQSTLTSVTIDAAGYSGTVTGMAATTTGVVTCNRTGYFITVYIAATIQGTSNSTAMTLAGMPAAFRPNTQITVPSMNMLDNSVNAGGWATVATTGVITFGFGIAGNPAGFTAANLKGLQSGWCIVFPKG